MKKFILPILLLIVSLTFYACKKEEIGAQEFVQKKILGRWPLKYNIRTVYTDNVVTKTDTLVTYSPVDTLIFTEDGMATKRNNTIISSVKYSIGANGETITFNSTPAVTLQITFVRASSIGFGSQTITQVAGKEVRTVTDDQYKQN